MQARVGTKRGKEIKVDVKDGYVYLQEGEELIDKQFKTISETLTLNQTAKMMGTVMLIVFIIILFSTGVAR